ncbi:hypothetical protein Tsubulata_002564 [Turnera subulata]|uniref:3'-5' exonuclease n=1 Tax=Turnera subulata TaxID=218843 RepID=A0A9Q0JM63_9ROSI|nr:hypothetical protein Tsubulata_002564 [Turnera subulata]
MNPQLKDPYTTTTNSALTKSDVVSSSSSTFPSPSIHDDWEDDQPLSDQDLQVIDAIEATFQSTSSSANKRHSSSLKTDDDGGHHREPTRRKLPNSILGLFSSTFTLSPCEASVKMRFPALKFTGQIFYSRTVWEVEKAAKELLRELEAKRDGMRQWRPTFRAGVPQGKAAVMQICADKCNCHVMHIFHSGITRSLQLILEDSTLVGAGIGGDCRKVFKDYNVSVKAVEDLSSLANQKLGKPPKFWGLQSLSETFLYKELSKPNRIRLGNWEVDPLSNDQIKYAATDAFASLHLHQVLRSLPDSEPVTKN